MASDAMLRMQDSAGRLLLHFGESMSFQLYAATKDFAKGEQDWAASGDSVKARASDDEATISRGVGDAKVRVIEKVLLVEVQPFAALGGLTDEWRYTDSDGIERRLKKPVLSDDGTYWVARVGNAG